MPIQRPSLATLALLASLGAAGCGGPEDHRAAPPANGPGAWRELVGGESPAGWRRLDFGGDGGAVGFAEGSIKLGRGMPLAAVVIDDPSFAPPADDYELVARARKLDGRDFFCALTFPVPEKEAHCTFVAGGWGGGVTGLSNIDHLDANRNRTRSSLFYETGLWYELRVEVRRGRIRCWVDERLVVNALIADRLVSLRPGDIEQCAPLGLASYETAAEISSLRIRALPPETR